MPLIKIASLPLNSDENVGRLLVDISEDLAATTDIELKHISVTWQTIESGHYAWAGKVCDHQPQDSHPILASILLPDIYKTERINQILKGLAQVISQRLGISKSNIFITLEKVAAGCVFDEGKIVRW